MGTTKSECFTEEQNQIAILTKAIGHPSRIAIIEHLIKVDSCICGDIVNELPLSQPTVSQHLKELKNAGLIKGTVEGNKICYCLNKEGFSKLKIFFDHINTYLEKNKNQCC
ncbi:winged helix-turn-helix transcriptional regulator [Flavobacterium sp. P4023]|uniref:Winged helix-turn-helix transcriptional regulator n=1 Tax=Flavobacterium flabelliforme TaxID=2816119 RepID=A0ABS5CTE4_9FLAO|nr:metalloregulator ArsR/SmtB family transcription factor [Flavobacterium flabelliforme]MBP4141891.1 winged helix-turn-helix transcriptional regulator [Flavobacterium flabelliforme]